MKNEPLLDRRLREWARRREVGPERLDALASGIERLARQPRMIEPAVIKPASRAWKAAYAFGGALAMAVLFLIVECVREPPAPNGVAGGWETANSDRGNSIRLLFSEASRLFPEQLRWLSQSNGEVGLGVESANPKAIPRTPPVLIRLIVLSRTAPETRWREAWATEVIARTEDLVEIAPSRQAGNHLTLWVYNLENGKLAVETDLRLEKPVKLASRLNAIMTLRQPMEMAPLRSGNTEYKVIQVVEPVAHHEGNGQS